MSENERPNEDPGEGEPAHFREDEAVDEESEEAAAKGSGQPDEIDQPAHFREDEVVLPPDEDAAAE